MLDIDINILRKIIQIVQINIEVEISENSQLEIVNRRTPDPTGWEKEMK